MKAAIGTSLLVIAVNCAAGLAGHLTAGGFDWKTDGARHGARGRRARSRERRLSDRFHPKGLRRIFAWFVVAVALYLIARNYNALL